MSENIELLKRVISNYAERHRNDELFYDPAAMARGIHVN